MNSTNRIVILRVLLPAGRDQLGPGVDVVECGIDSNEADWMTQVEGAMAIVADPTTPVGSELLEAAGDSLKVVANFAVGYDNIDLEACSERGIVVTNTPDVLTDATAELAVTLTLAAARDIATAERSLRSGGWSGWKPDAYMGVELRGSTVGVVGMGRIGQRYAEIMSGFGVELLYTSREVKGEVEGRLGARKVALEELFSRADVVSLHLPVTDETRYTINRDSLRLMKPTAILVNTGRGGLVDTAAVVNALEEGLLGAAGFDVFENEPEVPEDLLEAPRTVLTPHIGSATVRARDLMAELVARNVVAVLGGEEPPTRVI